MPFQAKVALSDRVRRQIEPQDDSGGSNKATHALECNRLTRAQLAFYLVHRRRT
jgi:hypothetical protein